ncbi:hypothetical protein BCR39DRAFT_522595 [Naematelia encephala]|uniref:Uncharacterized protein n=1 Tax=Naematelia encephala TaxID=71784 RepID=A0A1Y2BCF1_9TREE|nr:hypothetical protein BCR39DRAFT_522595 [Naematelia encephala]
MEVFGSVVVLAALLGFAAIMANREDHVIKAHRSLLENATLITPEKLDLVLAELKLLRQAVDRIGQRA